MYKHKQSKILCYSSSNTVEEKKNKQQPNKTKSLSSKAPLSQWYRQPHRDSWWSRKLYLQMLHLIASSSRQTYLNQHPGAYEATHKKKTTNQPK